MIQVASPDIDQTDINSVSEVLQTGMLVQGANVQEFEKSLKSWTSSDYEQIAVSNGTAALHLALLALGIKSGDKVIVPTYSWPATANVVEACNATPVFCDIEELTFGIDPIYLEKLIKADDDRKSIKAVIVVHAFGCIPNIDSIARVCDDFNIPLIEDAACAIGSTFNSKNAGSFGAISCFSFHPRKIITTGEGGLVCSRSKQLADKIRALRNHGIDSNSKTPIFNSYGLNYRMTDFQGALGVNQLKKLPSILAHRNEIARTYSKEFSNSSISLQKPPQDSTTNWQSFVILLPKGVDRDSIIKKMGNASIACTIGTWHIPLTKFYKEKYGYKTGDFLVTDDIFARSLTLPLHSKIDQSQAEMIARTLLKLLK